MVADDILTRINRSTDGTRNTGCAASPANVLLFFKKLECGFEDLENANVRHIEPILVVGQTQEPGGWQTMRMLIGTLSSFQKYCRSDEGQS